MRSLLFSLGVSAWSTALLTAQVTNISSVTWDKVPPAVQTSILRESGNVAVQTIESGFRNGQPVYSVSVPQAEGATRIVLDANGTVLLDQPAATLPVVAPVPEVVITTNELPEGVTKGITGGSATYTVESETSQISVTPNARVLRATDASGTQMDKITWLTLPAVVQTAVQEQSGPGRILDITRGTYNGQSIYEVVYEQNTQRTRLRLSETGEVLGQDIISTEDRRSIPVEPFIGAQNVPVSVMTTLRAAAGTNPIESVQQEVVEGRITYVGVFREKGQPVTLRLSQTGQILR